MAINSIKFILFSLAVIILYYITPKKFRWITLLIASYMFYYLASGKLIIFILLSSFIIYLSALIMNGKEKKKKKTILLLSVFLNVLLLFLLKYFNYILSLFKVESVAGIIAPIGISYYTLQAISYVVDVYRGKYEPDKNFFKVSLFLTYFPIITEGPISRYDKLSKELFAVHELDYDNIKYGFVLILYGFFKKMVIADRCGIFVNLVFKGAYQGFAIFLAIALYTIQLYVEFSACIEIVSGISKILGINLDKNFERPFFSKSVQEFWRRWHITLGAWLKDYIFYPVSLSKANMKLNKFMRKKMKNNVGKVIIAAFPLFFVWIINGVWHGVGIKYVIYGMYYYLVMILGMLFKPVFDWLIKTLKINVKSFGFKLFSIIRTVLLVMLGMLIFKADSISSVFVILGNMFKPGSLSLFTKDFGIIDLVLVSLFVIFLVIKGIFEEKGVDVYQKLNNSNLIVQDALLIFTLLMIAIFGIYGNKYNPADFIYGGF